MKVKKNLIAAIIGVFVLTVVLWTQFSVSAKSSALSEIVGVQIVPPEAIPVDCRDITLARTFGLTTGWYQIISRRPNLQQELKRAVAIVGTGVDDRIPDLAGRVIHRKLIGSAIYDPNSDPHETGMASIIAGHAGDPLVWPSGQFNGGAGTAGTLGIFPDAYLIDIVIPKTANGRIQGSDVAEAFRYLHQLQLPGYQIDTVNCSFTCLFDSGLEPALHDLAMDRIIVVCSAGQTESVGGVGGEVTTGGPFPAAFAGDPDTPNVTAVGAVLNGTYHPQAFYGTKVMFVGPWQSPADGPSLVGGAVGNAYGTSPAAAWVTSFMQALATYNQVDAYTAREQLRLSCTALPLRSDGTVWASDGLPDLGKAFDQQVNLAMPLLHQAFRQSKKVLVLQGEHLSGCRVFVNGVEKTGKIDSVIDTQIVLFGKPGKLGLQDNNTVQVLGPGGLPSNTFTFPF